MKGSELGSTGRNGKKYLRVTNKQNLRDLELIRL